MNTKTKTPSDDVLRIVKAPEFENLFLMENLVPEKRNRHEGYPYCRNSSTGVIICLSAHFK